MINPDLTCKNCGSNKIIRNVKIVEYGHGNIKKNLTVQITKSKDKLFDQIEKGELLTDICGECGNIKLRINNFKNLWEAHIHQ